MKQGKFAPIEGGTICENITEVFHCLMGKGMRKEAQMLKKVFLKAKRMNRKLVYNACGYLPHFSDNSWDEKDWIKEWKEMGRKYK